MKFKASPQDLSLDTLQDLFSQIHKYGHTSPRSAVFGCNHSQGQGRTAWFSPPASTKASPPTALPQGTRTSSHFLTPLWAAAPFGLGRHDLLVLPQQPSGKAMRNSWTEEARCNVSFQLWQSKANSLKAAERRL